MTLAPGRPAKVKERAAGQNGVNSLLRRGAWGLEAHKQAAGKICPSGAYGGPKLKKWGQWPRIKIMGMRIAASGHIFTGP